MNLYQISMYIRVQSRAFHELHAVLPQSAPDTVFISLQLSDTEIVIARKLLLPSSLLSLCYSQRN